LKKKLGEPKVNPEINFFDHLYLKIEYEEKSGFVQNKIKK